MVCRGTYRTKNEEEPEAGAAPVVLLPVGPALLILNALFLLFPQKAKKESASALVVEWPEPSKKLGDAPLLSDGL